MPRTDKSVRQWKAKLKKYPVLFNGCDCSTCGAGHVYTYENENNKLQAEMESKKKELESKDLSGQEENLLEKDQNMP